MGITTERIAKQLQRNYRKVGWVIERKGISWSQQKHGKWEKERGTENVKAIQKKTDWANEILDASIFKRRLWNQNMVRAAKWLMRMYRKLWDTLIHGLNIVNLEEASDNIDGYELRKISRYVQKCKEKTWAKWTSEYLKALRKQHNLKHESRDIQILKGDFVLIKDNEKNRGKWNIGIVQHINKGKDENIRSVKLRC